ncbi:MAG: glycoside hydrolase family 2, partial [Treponema sp.]|nr:glycoside hydrolase family 2 [Treponema sp.]
MIYQQDYPRPQFVRLQDSWENLNGSWDFSFDDQHEGIKENWFHAFPKGTLIQVPFAYESPKSGIEDTRQHSIVWYHRTFTIHEKQKKR